MPQLRVRETGDNQTAGDTSKDAPTTGETEENLPRDTRSTLTKAEKKIISANTDKADVAGSKFAKLQLKATGKNKSVQLTWKKVTVNASKITVKKGTCYIYVYAQNVYPCRIPFQYGNSLSNLYR